MKKTRILKVIIIAVISMTCMMAASCNKDEDNPVDKDWQNIIDNHGKGRFEIDENGRCFGITSIREADVKKTIAGHGWKEVDTWEIDEKGKRNKVSYYKDLIGASPHDFYFTEDSVRMYYTSDAMAMAALYNDYKWSWYEDTEYHSNRSRIVIGDDQDDYLQIIGWSDDMFCAIRYIAFRANDERNIYGVSLYRKMTDKELKEYNEKYKNSKDFKWPPTGRN